MGPKLLKQDTSESNRMKNAINIILECFHVSFACQTLPGSLKTGCSCSLWKDYVAWLLNLSHIRGHTMSLHPNPPQTKGCVAGEKWNLYSISYKQNIKVSCTSWWKRQSVLIKGSDNQHEHFCLIQATWDKSSVMYLVVDTLQNVWWHFICTPAVPACI